MANNQKKNAFLLLIENGFRILLGLTLVILAMKIRASDIPVVVQTVVEDGFAKLVTLAIASLIGLAIIVWGVVWWTTRK